MATPVLVTKLHVPSPDPRAVSRDRLLARLDEGAHRRLTLVSAPAGFGKTTLVAEWVERQGRRVAWLSLDEADSDATRFLAHVVAALQRVVPALGEEVAHALRSPQPPPVEATLTALLNAIAETPDPLVLVLDDYHFIDADPVDQAVAFLLDHLPPHLHVVITTREDPRFPLSRLRARGQMTEVRAAELRFTAGEADAFLNETMGLALSPADIAALETRTEGWIAGLQLAALSLRDRTDTPGFIRAFAGDDRYIVDYLVEEVLRRQPATVRQFLLQTSILDRLSGPLCEAVTGQAGAGARLEALERSGVLIVPLDDRRQWYRYHHLFADVLRVYLLDEQPADLPVLHRRASDWFERHGERSEAVRHALAAGDAERAADLVELAAPALRRSRQEATLLAWLEALPESVFRHRPVLGVIYAGVLLQCGGPLERVESWLREAERWVDPAPGGAPPAGMIVLDEAGYRRLPGEIALYRAGQALARGDVAGTTLHAGHARDLLADDDDFGRGAAAGLLGLALWTSGDLDRGHRMYTECMARLHRAGFISDTFGCALALADIRIAQGRLHEAMATCERALQVAVEHGTPAMRGTADMHVAMSEILRERNDLEGAARHLTISREQGEHTGLPQHPWRWRVGMARIREAEGDVEGALALLDESQRRYTGDLFPDVRPIAALKARVWIARGRLGEALGWARDRELSLHDAPGYLREYEHVTLARLMLARFRRDGDDGELAGTIGLLARLLAAAEAGGRGGSAIEIGALLALAHEARGDLPRALPPLERAMTLAEPEGHVRVFVDEGEPMARLLAEARARGVLPEHAGRLLVAFGEASAGSGGPARAGAAMPLAEPLSRREIEVLGLIAEGLSNREIGERLYLALDTVKGHNRRIFAKLGAQRRTEALSRARALGLL